MQSTETQSRVAFGVFEADLSTGEIWRGGFRIKLQSQPFRVLAALLQRAGQVVTREELQELVWGKSTTVDFDHSLATAINKIREALNDSAENPRFVETLARRGYRFIAPVSMPETVPTESQAWPTSDATVSPEPQLFPEVPAAHALALPGLIANDPSGRVKARNSRFLWLLAGGTLALTLLAVGFFLGGRAKHHSVWPIRQITHSAGLMPGGNALESFPAAVTDGPNVYASVIHQGGIHLERITIPLGNEDSIRLPKEVAGPAITDISHNGSRLLIRSHASNESEQPLFIVPVAGGSAQRIPRVLAHDATWMPDDAAVLYAFGNELFLTRLDNSPPEPYAKLQGRPFWLRWSPDGTRLRFTLFDPLAHTQSLWELQAATRRVRPLLQGWNQPHEECCGVWTADGSDYIFQAARGARSDLWMLPGASSSKPERLTNGPLAYEAPAASRTGQTVYFSGVDNQGEVQLLGPGSREFQPAHSFFSDARRIDASRDGKWIAWVDGEGHLWRARPDGTELLQLTPANLEVFTARWSPDHTRLAIMARAASSAWSIYQVLSDGSDLQPFLKTEGNTGDPGWSPDGGSIVFGRAPDLMGKDSEPRVIQTLNLRTHEVQTLPNSQDLFSPRWSPDGRYIAALTLDQRQIRIYDVAARTWHTLLNRSVADPVWSADSNSIYADAFMDAGQPIYRVSVSNGRIEDLASITSFRSDDVIDFIFAGLLSDDVVAVRGRRSSANLYSIDLSANAGASLH
jgi:DNA-binding winged helix-turn-helix (wHTH) protein/Tol biopolymer transport system component